MKRRYFLKGTLAGAALTTVGASLRGTLSAALEPKRILALGGTSAPLSGSYTRMFPGLRGKPSRLRADIEEGLTKLGEAMVDNDPPIELENQPECPPAGYTYLGQFIDHDLSLDLTPLANATDNVEQTPNFRTPFLDLDQLYGGGPNLSPFLYQNKQEYRGAERFLIGKTQGPNSSEDDLPRNPEGIALTGDPRQDENLFLAQLHLAFLKLHNLVVARRKDLDAYRRNGDSDFVAAQRLVRWHYQWIVRHDYLKAILDPNVFAGLAKLEEAKLEEAQRPNSQPEFKIPVEFNVAAFRFGHSMVRDVYARGLNEIHAEVKLPQIMEQTGIRGGANPALKSEWVISWEHFFEIAPRTSHLNRARKIDTQIAKELHNFDKPTVTFSNVPLPGQFLQPVLPARTLLRGFRVDLPSGEDVAAEIARREPDTRVLTEEEIANSRHGEILTDPKYGFRQNTPLWYYILREAELVQGGWCLGPVCSHIIADVIIGALAADSDSYLWAHNWVPTLDGGVNSMSQILSFILAASSSTGSST